MSDENPLREREHSDVADPYQAPAIELRPAAVLDGRRIALRVVEWTLGLPLGLLGLMQCGVAVTGLALSFVTDIPFTSTLLAALFVNGLMLAVPGALLCAGRSWAAWFVLAVGLFAIVVGAVRAAFVLIAFGGLLATFAIAIVILAALARRGRP